MLDRVALTPVEHVRQHVETLLDPLQELVRDRGRRGAVELFADRRDLPDQPFDDLLGQIAARRELVDALRQDIEAVDDLDIGTVVDEFFQSAAPAR